MKALITPLWLLCLMGMHEAMHAGHEAMKTVACIADSVV